MRAPSFWQNRGVISTLLLPASQVYGWAGRRLRARVQPREAGLPVICIGNLVAGGAGKTPLALAVIGLLKQRGIAAHAITRGYGGSMSGPLRVDPARHGADAVGDEALLLARSAPTWVAHDRVAGARAARAAGAQVVVLDDGYQNPSLKKDFSILAVDGGYGFGNGQIIPAGPLREGVGDGLARADLVVVMGEDRVGLMQQLPPLLAAPHGAPAALLQARVQPSDPDHRLEGRRLLAFAGIARPEKFFASLRAAGASILMQETFGDHHRFTENELAILQQRAGELKAELITTEKDHVRLPKRWRDRVGALAIEVVWDDADALSAVLHAFLTRHGLA